MDEKIKEIEEAVRKFEIEYPDSDTMGEYIEYLLSRIKELRLRVNSDYSFYKEIMVKDKTRIKELEDGINEVLDGTLPYLAEKRLRELVK